MFVLFKNDCDNIKIKIKNSNREKKEGKPTLKTKIDSLFIHGKNKVKNLIYTVNIYKLSKRRSLEVRFEPGIAIWNLRSQLP